jgi:hypothetical protein
LIAAVLSLLERGFSSIKIDPLGMNVPVRSRRQVVSAERDRNG